MDQHKKTFLSILIGFAALMFVFAYFPAAPNAQPGMNAFPPTQPDMDGPGPIAPEAARELLPEGRLSEVIDPSAQQLGGNAGGSQDLSSMMNDVYGSTRSDLPVVQGRNLPASSPPPMPQGSWPTPMQQGNWPQPMAQGGWPTTQSSAGMQQFGGFPGMQQQSLSFAPQQSPQQPSGVGFALPNAPKKDLWSSIFGSENKDEAAKSADNSRQESSYNATQYELGIARNKASQAQAYLDRVRSASNPSEKQSAASEAQYYASEARAAAERASYKAQGNPQAQSLVSSARAEAARASSAASSASSEASY